MQISKIIMGGMRFISRSTAGDVIHRAIDNGFNYIDTSPCYCNQSEEENSESWIGTALAEASYRKRILVSTKCAVGNGGLELGDFNPSGGFGVRTAAQLRQVFNQSLSRLAMDRVDYYHLWTTHTREQFTEAQKPGGWFEAVDQLRSEGKFDHVGITTHADNDTIIHFLESGRFETVTIPLNIINTTRMRTVEYCARNGIAVIAMNPLAGGFLGKNPRLAELAFEFLMGFDNVHILPGMANTTEVDYAAAMQKKYAVPLRTTEAVLAEVNSLINPTEARCTACGYCMPCPQNINLGASLSYYNLFKYMGMAQAKQAFVEKQWEEGLRLDKCVKCGLCATRCPNHLPLMDVITQAQDLLYAV